MGLTIKKILLLVCLSGFAASTAHEEFIFIDHEPKHVLTKNDKKQIECLAQNIYHEARGEPKLGQVAVTNVVMNRVDDQRFPSNPCSVIMQRNRNGCQFTWVCQNKRVKNWAKYNKCLEIAKDVYIGEIDDVTNGAQFYHATYVRPFWSRIFERTTKIGLHVFYRA